MGATTTVVLLLLGLGALSGAVYVMRDGFRYEDGVRLTRLLDAWRWAGHHYGLKFFQRRAEQAPDPTEGDLRLVGVIDGAEIELRASLAASRRWTRAELRLEPALVTEFEVVCEAPLERVDEAHRFDGVGDPEFDPYFLVASASVAETCAVLAPDVREGLRALHDVAAVVRLTRERLVIEAPRVLDDGKALQQWLDGLLDVSHALRQARHREAAQRSVEVARRS